MLIRCSPNIAPSKIVQYLKGRLSRLIQDEFPELKKKYWANICGQEDIFVQQLVVLQKKLLNGI